MTKNLIIVAGGQGKRMGYHLPKQFLVLGNMPVIMHTINNFLFYDNHINIIIALPDEHFETWNKLCNEYKFTHQHVLTKGGKTRFETVKNSLSFIENEGITAIHDAVRPFVNLKTIKSCFEKAREKGAAIPVISLNESIRKVHNNSSISVDREQYKIVQTPQVFHNNILLKAYEQDYKVSFTDDASVVESSGYKIHLVEGNIENIKLTSKHDLILANEYIKQI